MSPSTANESDSQNGESASGEKNQICSFWSPRESDCSSDDGKTVGSNSGKLSCFDCENNRNEMESVGLYEQFKSTWTAQNNNKANDSDGSEFLQAYYELINHADIEKTDDCEHACDYCCDHMLEEASDSEYTLFGQTLSTAEDQTLDLDSLSPIGGSDRRNSEELNQSQTQDSLFGAQTDF